MPRVAILTGAAGGIGQATAKLFRSDGWTVVGVDVVENVPGVDRAVQADLADLSDVERAIREISKDYSCVEALIHNAAEQVVKPLADTNAAEWDRVLAVNLRAAFLLARGLKVGLAEASGAIVNVASIHAILTSPGLAAYAASKGGLVALTRVMALEFAPDGIRANAVLPGAIDTAMLGDGLERAHLKKPGDDALGRLITRQPLGRIGRPVEVAQAIRFLADPETASFITGQTLIVDGGAGAQLSTE